VYVNGQKVAEPPGVTTVIGTAIPEVPPAGVVSVIRASESTVKSAFVLPKLAQQISQTGVAGSSPAAPVAADNEDRLQAAFDRTPLPP
jgi:hypothetical protein